MHSSLLLSLLVLSLLVVVVVMVVREGEHEKHILQQLKLTPRWSWCSRVFSSEIA